jgi:hormone-sensitive lipase
MVNQELHNQDAYRKELFVKSKSKLKIRVLCSEVLLNPQDDDGFDLEDDELVSFGFMRSLKRMFATKRVVSSKVHDTILFHIHGGGFISQSSSTHQCHTREYISLISLVGQSPLASQSSQSTTV